MIHYHSWQMYNYNNYDAEGSTGNENWIRIFVIQQVGVDHVITWYLVISCTIWIRHVIACCAESTHISILYLKINTFLNKLYSAFINKKLIELIHAILKLIIRILFVNIELETNIKMFCFTDLRIFTFDENNTKLTKMCYAYIFRNRALKRKWFHSMNILNKLTKWAPTNEVF